MKSVKRELQRNGRNLVGQEASQAGGTLCKVFIRWKYREVTIYVSVATVDFLQWYDFHLKKSLLTVETRLQVFSSQISLQILSFNKY